MRITDLDENISITEAPMGAWDTIKNKVRSKLPGEAGADEAEGRLATGKRANDLKRSFSRFVGAANAQPTPKVLYDFLKRSNVLTQAMAQELQMMPNSATLTPKMIDQYLHKAVQSLQTSSPKTSTPAAPTTSTTATGIWDLMQKMPAKEYQHLVNYIKTNL